MLLSPLPFSMYTCCCKSLISSATDCTNTDFVTLRFTYTQYLKITKHFTLLVLFCSLWDKVSRVGIFVLLLHFSPFLITSCRSAIMRAQVLLHLKQTSLQAAWPPLSLSSACAMSVVSCLAKMNLVFIYSAGVSCQWPKNRSLLWIRNLLTVVLSK